MPCGWNQQPNGVNCNNGSSVNYNPVNQTYTVTSTNCYYGDPFASDAMAFSQRTLCGDGSITAQVTSLTGTGWAGVVMRETNAAGAKKVQLMSNLSSLHRREVRYTTSGTSYPQQSASNQRFWLRIVRQGNQFIGYASPNGSQWYQVMAVTVSMNNCIQMGLVVTNNQTLSTVSATFANVSYTGSNEGLQAPLIINRPLDSYTLLDFTLYPNPTTGELNVDLAQYLGRTIQIELRSLQGQLLQSTKLQTVDTKIKAINLSAFPNGMYFVSIQSEGLPAVTKRVVLSELEGW